MFSCDATTTTTEGFDALQECGEELGAFRENLSDECIGYDSPFTSDELTR